MQWLMKIYLKIIFLKLFQLQKTNYLFKNFTYAVVANYQNSKSANCQLWKLFIYISICMYFMYFINISKQIKKIKVKFVLAI